MLRSASLAMVLVACAVCTACGSGYDKADFVARADAICARALRDTRAVPPPTSQQSSALAPYAATVLAIVRHENEQLQGLALPPQGAAARKLLRDYLAAAKSAVGDYAALASAAKHGDGGGVASAEAGLRSNPVSVLAQRYGLRDCAAPGATVG
jgi:hypothetical protein